MVRSANVLIVDDEAGTIRVLGALLSDAGYRVESASDGAVALEMLAASAQDVVLLDYLMPHVDGCETLRAIRRSKAFAGVRVVMMSGVSESIVRRNCRVSYEAFLHKPFSLDELLRVVKRVTRPAKAHAKKRARSRV